ncbi:MAG: Ig-like domain-containing protein, partial [Bacteroidota bacterium]
MNKAIQKSILLILLALGVPLVGFGQISVDLTTYQGSILEYEFTSEPIDPDIYTYPEHGSATIIETGTFQHKLLYQPSADYLGSDQIRVFLWTAPGQYTIRTLNITVLPSQVIAVRDQVTTTVNTPVDILVTANDYSNRGVLLLNHTPITNHGTTLLDEDLGIITFVPESDFTGMANFNYVVCDDIGTCTSGTVSVHVVTGLGNTADTTVIFTREDRPQVVLLPDGYNLTSGPTSGTFDVSPDAPVYTPNVGFVGDDYMVFDYMGASRVVRME